MITLLLTIVFLPLIIVFGIISAVLELLFCPFALFRHHHHHHGLFGHHHCCWGHHHWW